MSDMVLDTMVHQQDGGALLQGLRASHWLPEAPEKDGSRQAYDYSSCLTALCNALDIHPDCWEICTALPARGSRLSKVDLMNVMANLGYVAHHAHIHLCDLDTRLVPCLFVPDDPDVAPFLVLQNNAVKGEGKAHATAMRVFILAEECAETWEEIPNISGDIWFFIEESQEENPLSLEKQRQFERAWFSALLARFRPQFLQALALGTVISLTSLSVPLFVMLVYDRVIGAHAPETLMPLVIGAGLALGAEMIMRTMRAQSLAWFGARLDFIVSTNIFGHLLAMPPAFIERASVASQIARMNAFDVVRDFFTSTLFSSIIELPFTVIFLIAIMIIAGPVVLVPVGVSVLYIALALGFKHRIFVLMKRSAQASIARQEMTIETFEKIEALHIGGLGPAWFRMYRNLSGAASLAGFKVSFIVSIIETISGALFVLSGMGVLIWGIFRVWDGDMTSGALIATMIISWRVLAPAQSLCNALPRYEQIGKAIGQINQLMDIRTEQTGQAKMGEIKGHVSFGRVGLRYSKERDPVFAGLSFEVQPGQLIALSGGSGVGKSTILKLISGMYRPQAGAIAIDGIDIRQFDPQDLRRQISYIPQMPAIFSGTIAENLRFADPLASDDKLEEALKKAGGWGYVETLPAGIHTRLNAPMSSYLSSGFIYHLGLARAYIKDAQITLIDELPYAFLNSPAGQVFKNILRDWKGQRTVIMVTHRTDYLKMADSVVFLRPNARAVIGRPDQVLGAIEKSYQGGINGI